MISHTQNEFVHRGVIFAPENKFSRLDGLKKIFLSGNEFLHSKMSIQAGK